MKNQELADLLFDKMAEYLERTPAGKVLVRVSSAAGKSSRELLPAFVEVLEDTPHIVRVSYYATVMGEAYDLKNRPHKLSPEKILRIALTLDKAATVELLYHKKQREYYGKAFLIRDISNL